MFTVHKKEKVITMGVAPNTSSLFVGHCKFFTSFFAIPPRKIWKPLVFTKPDVVPFAKCGRFPQISRKKRKILLHNKSSGETLKVRRFNFTIAVFGYPMSRALGKTLVMILPLRVSVWGYCNLISLCSPVARET